MSAPVIGLNSLSYFGENCSSTQLSRNLERVLEDAQLTGELNISGRRLKEFPKIASRFNLNDTVLADLSKNKLSEFPVEVCDFYSLERLNCYHNSIRCVPEDLFHFRSLTHLNFARNQFSVISLAMCQLTNLQVLCLSNNRLVALPEEINRLKNLMHLDVSCNQISCLPVQIGDMANLRRFNVRRNLLVELPLELTELNLTHLNISGNRISNLPVEIRLISTLVELCADNNPLVSPPAQVCSRGKVHIFKYLDIQAIKENKKRGMYGNDYRKSMGLNGIAFGNYRRKRYTIDSGYNTSDYCADQRWSQELSNDDDEPSTIQAIRAAQLTKEKRQIKSSYCRSTNQNGVPLVTLQINEVPVNGSCFTSPDSTVPDYVNTSELQAYKSANGHSVNEEAARGGLPETVGTSNSHIQTYKEFKEAMRNQRSQENGCTYRWTGVGPKSISPVSPTPPAANGDALFESLAKLGLQQYVKPSVLTNETENVSHYNTNAALQQRLQEENVRLQKKLQKEAVLNFVKSRTSPLRSNESDYSSETTSTNSRTSPGPPLLTSHNVSLTLNTTSSSGSSSSISNFTSGNCGKIADLAKVDSGKTLLLKQAIESRLKITLPEDVGAALVDGVVLCHLANNLRPRSVASIHVPSAAVPRLSVAKCRRNVENFLDACRKFGVEESLLCECEDVLCGNLSAIINTLNQLMGACGSEPITEPQSKMADQAKMAEIKTIKFALDAKNRANLTLEFKSGDSVEGGRGVVAQKSDDSLVMFSICVAIFALTYFFVLY